MLRTVVNCNSYSSIHITAAADNPEVMHQKQEHTTSTSTRLLQATQELQHHRRHQQPQHEGLNLQSTSHDCIRSCKNNNNKKRNMNRFTQQIQRFVVCLLIWNLLSSTSTFSTPPTLLRVVNAFALTTTNSGIINTNCISHSKTIRSRFYQPQNINSYRIEATTNTIVATTKTTSTNRQAGSTVLRSDQTSSSSNNYDPMNNRHSASDWLYNVKSLPESKVLREIRNPVMAVFGWSLFVSVVYSICQKSNVSFLNRIATHMCIPGTAHSFLVSALGLLLVFRTNSAYQRFNEGRKIWEHILSVSRNMSRMIQLYNNEIGNERQRRIMNLVAAYPYLLRQHIRPGCLCSNNSPNIPPEYRLLLKEQRQTQHETRHEGQQHQQRQQYNFFRRTKNMNNQKMNRRYSSSSSSSEDNDDDFITIPDEQQHNTLDPMTQMSQTHSTYNNNNYNNVDQQQQQPTNTDSDCWVDRRALPWSLFIPQSLPAISRAENRPLWVCDRIAALICKIPYGPNFTSRERLVLLGMVDKLTNAIGQCERIHQTAVPLNYARHSLRSLTLWLFTLPFALVQDLGLLTAFANAVIAWLFFGVYQIGYSIEDPFQGSLRLSILCDAIRRSVIRQPSTTYPDEDSAYQLSPEECLNIYTSTSSDGNPANIPEECLYLPTLTDVIRRSVKTEESMSLSLEEAMILEQQEKLMAKQKQAQQQQQQQIQANNNTTKDTTKAATNSAATTLSSTTSTVNVPQPTTTTDVAQPTTTKTIWSLDEEMLATPKIVTYKNGTWSEVGI